MTDARPPSAKAREELGRALRLTRWGMVAECATRSFWPLWSLLLAGIAPLMLGLHDRVPPEFLWIGAGLWLAALLVALAYGVRRFRWPTRRAAQARLDATLPGRPIAAIDDNQAIGVGDVASRAVWQAHRDRMQARLTGARPVAPDLRISDRDPIGLRYMALLAFLVALLFGGFGRVGGVAELMPGAGGAALAAGPSWEGWAEPPAYTGKPSLYLNDLTGNPLIVPTGTRLTLRFYGPSAGTGVRETVSGLKDAPRPDSAGSMSFDVARSGTLTIGGRDGASWQVTALPDQAPVVRLDGPMKREARGKMSQPFAARDDYGVVAGEATFALDLAEVDRRYGLATVPDARDAITLDLPLPITGSHADFNENLVDDLSKHPWSGLPVTMQLQVVDAAGQTGRSKSAKLTLPGRRFFDPLAAAVIEQRRDLLWARANGARVAQVLRAVINRPEGFVRNQSGYLMSRIAITRLEAANSIGLDAATQTEVADALWQIALLFEDGALSDARERMQRAQDRLSEAMKNGASDAEIADLMQELREATRDYMRQLAEQQRQNGDQQTAQNQQPSQQITQEQIQALMDRIQELMEQGRMAEAQELMKQFNEMMQNLRVTENQQGGKGQNPGQQAMDGLKDTLRQQQGLSDQAFRDLQEQFNSQTGAGQSQQNEGQSGGQGRGQSHEGQGGDQGQGQGNQQQGQSGQSQPGQSQSGQSQSGEGQSGEGQAGQDGAAGQRQSLAERQQALRNELRRQQGNLPGAGSPEGKAAREALGRAGDAMDKAEQALRKDDLAEALNQQADAMEALREGLRNLGRALAQQQQQQQPGQQGQAVGRADQKGQDQLGRESGSNGRVGTNRNLLQGEDVYRRARDLLDEIRRRSGEKNRPESEREYLKRLLDQF